MNIIKTDDLQQLFSIYGLNFKKDTIFNFYLSLISKPFVILSGISGSGKSKIAEVFAKIVNDSKEKNYELIPVKPNWRDSKGILGYHNLLDNSYCVTPAIKLFIRALSNPDSPFFLILDEMNIAKTEHYFADYLSVIESRYQKISGYNDISFDESFSYPVGTSLSEAIILAAIDINKGPDTPLAIEDYRENRFSKKWKQQFSEGNNWTAQFRSEINQGENRLAYRVFSGGNGYYALKQKSKLNDEDLKTFEKLETFYSSLFKPIEIVQENIVLHDCNKCLGTNGKICDKDCSFCNSEKYKCKYLYDDETYFIPPELPIPLNVFTIGTVNIDETTYMFSPKVLDRSNVIEFNNIDFSTIYNCSTNQDVKEKLNSLSSLLSNENFYFRAGTEISSMKVSIPTKEKVNSFINSSSSTFCDLIGVYEILQKYNMHFGYRVMNEISAYICNASILSNCKNVYECALDFQFLQKILPKLNGSFEKMWNPLTEILLKIKKGEIECESFKTEKEIISFFNNFFPSRDETLLLSEKEASHLFKYPKTAIKLSRMLNDLSSDGFTSYIK